MSDKVKLAAERVRRYRAAETPEQRETAYGKVGPKNSLGAIAVRMRQDELTLCDAYLDLDHIPTDPGAVARLVEAAREIEKATAHAAGLSKPQISSSGLFDGINHGLDLAEIHGVVAAALAAFQPKAKE